MKTLKALVLLVYILPFVPVEGLEVDAPDDSGDETPEKTPKQTELIRRKKEALKLLFNSAERKVPIIYNRNSELFQQYLSARFTRLHEEAEELGLDEHEDQDYPIELTTPWDGEDSKEITTTPKARQSRIPPTARVKKQAMIDLGLDSNPPFEQQDFAAYMTLRTETDLEAAPARRRSSGGPQVRDELRSFIQQLKSLDNFESVRLSSILPQDSNEITEDKNEVEPPQEDTTVTFFHNGDLLDEEKPSLRGQFVISEAVPTSNSEIQRPLEELFQSQPSHRDFQRSIDPEEDHGHEKKAGLDKHTKLTDVVEVGGILYRSPNPSPTPPSPTHTQQTFNPTLLSSLHSQPPPTLSSRQPFIKVLKRVTTQSPPSYSSASGTLYRQALGTTTQRPTKADPSERVPTRTPTQRPTKADPSERVPTRTPKFAYLPKLTTPKYYMKLVTEQPYTQRTTPRPKPTPTYPFLEVEVQSTPPPTSSPVYYKPLPSVQGFFVQSDPSPPQPNQSQSYQSSPSTQYVQSSADTFTVEATSSQSDSSQGPTIPSRDNPPVPTYVSEESQGNPFYSSKDKSYIAPYTPSFEPPPIPTYVTSKEPPQAPTYYVKESQESSTQPKESPETFKYGPREPAPILQHAVGTFSDVPSYTSFQSSPDSRPSPSEGEFTHYSHPPTPKFVKHISPAAPTVKPSTYPPGYNKEVENTTPYPLVYGFKPVYSF